MNKHNAIPPLDSKGLRKFGFTMAAMIVLLFALIFPWIFGSAMPWWPWATAGLLTLWALAYPVSLNFLYHGWMHLGLALGWFSSRIVLGTLFYLVFTPVSWVLSLRGLDPLKRRLDAEATTYRTESRTRDISHMEKPF